MALRGWEQSLLCVSVDPEAHTMSASCLSLSCLPDLVFSALVQGLTARCVSQQLYQLSSLSSGAGGSAWAQSPCSGLGHMLTSQPSLGWEQRTHGIGMSRVQAWGMVGVQPCSSQGL